MKSIKIAGLCLVSMLMMSMALASAASAAPLWLVCLEGTAATSKYSSNQCSKTEAGGKWESVSLGTKSDTVNIVAYSLKLADTGTGVEIECPLGSNGWGLIEGPNKGQIKVAEIVNAGVNCKVLKGAALCKKIEKVNGVNLPWKTELFEEKEKLLTKLEKGAGAAGEPGWLVKCEGVPVDICTSPPGEPEQLELLNAFGGSAGTQLQVVGRFEERSKGNCTVGGNGKGTIRGLVAILLWNGNGLSINPV
jgi:hypothetical protein